MHYDLVVKSGLVILPEGEQEVDVAIHDGKFVEIGKRLNGKEVIDADGLVVSPGMVDAHVHISEPGGGSRDEWEGYVTGTAAAAKGGVSTIIEMPLNQVPATIDGKTLARKLSAGIGKLHVDVASFGGLVPANIANNGIFELAAGGVVGYKAFLSTCGNRDIKGDFENVDDFSLYEGMRQIAKTGKVLTLHCENAAITDKLEERARARGESTIRAYVETRPVFTEVESVRRAVYLAKQTGVRLHIAHVSCTEVVEEVRKAQAEGMDITCETCPHYLYFSSLELDEIGTLAKCSPPIRDAANKDRLWQDLIAGYVDCVTSDHSPCTEDLKAIENALDAWGGISGIQNTVDLLFDEGVQKRGMSLKRFAKVIASKPAEIFGLHQKGDIQIGKDADLVFIQPDQSYVLEAKDLEYRNKISPYVGRTIGAQVVMTLVRGREVYSKFNGVSEGILGNFVKV